MPRKNSASFIKQVLLPKLTKVQRFNGFSLLLKTGIKMRSRKWVPFSATDMVRKRMMKAVSTGICAQQNREAVRRKNVLATVIATVPVYIRIWT